MKKLLWGRLSVLVLSISLVVSACSKPSDGKDGAAGATGPAGTANVIYSPWTDVTFTLNTTDSFYYATLAAPKLVDSILQKGTVMTYVNLNTAASPAIFSLPYFDGGVIIQSYYTAAKINMWSNYGGVSTTTSGGSKVQQYRYVIIPGGVTTGRSAIDWKNYAEVKEYLQLKD